MLTSGLQQTKRNHRKTIKRPQAFVAFNARHGLLGPYWFEEAGKMVSVNAACYRVIIKNLIPDDFYDDLSETPSEDQFRMAWFIQHEAPYLKEFFNSCLLAHRSQVGPTYL